MSVKVLITANTIAIRYQKRPRLSVRHLSLRGRAGRSSIRLDARTQTCAVLGGSWAAPKVKKNVSLSSFGSSESEAHSCPTGSGRTKDFLGRTKDFPRCHNRTTPATTAHGKGLAKP